MNRDIFIREIMKMYDDFIHYPYTDGIHKYIQKLI